jgi:ABC-type anion transport system duplicated permease subunit
VATGGIVGIGTALAAILDSQDIAAWIIGLAVSAVVVVLAAVLWSSRTL